MDFIDEVLAADVPIARNVTVRGKTGSVWFKRITAGQREQLLAGQRLQAKVGEKATMDVDLSQNQRTKHLLVQFSTCREDGKPVFSDLKSVQAKDAQTIDALYEHASAVNAEDEEAGNASGTLTPPDGSAD